MSNDRFFNLLKPIVEPKSSWDKIYDWILGRARVVLLFVEIIMVVLFFTKVVVDNIGKNRIQQFENVQLELLSLEEKHESEFIKIQNKVLRYTELWDLSSNFYPIFTEIIDNLKIPKNTYFFNISSNGRIQVNGYEDITYLRELEAVMKNSNTFTNVTVDTLTLEQEGLEQKGKYLLTAYIDTQYITRESLIK